MAFYHDENVIEKIDHIQFEKPWLPGQYIDCPGIYRCKNCGFEVAVARGERLPDTRACRDHLTPKWIPAARLAGGPVEWCLIVVANDLRPER